MSVSASPLADQLRLLAETAARVGGEGYQAGRRVLALEIQALVRTTLDQHNSPEGFADLLVAITKKCKEEITR